MHKYSVKLSVSFCALGSVQVKAAHKMLVKSTPGLDFINILCARFLDESAPTAFI